MYSTIIIIHILKHVLKHAKSLKLININFLYEKKLRKIILFLTSYNVEDPLLICVKQIFLSTTQGTIS